MKTTITNEAFDRITAKLTKTIGRKYTYTRNIDSDLVKVTDVKNNIEFISGNADYVYGYCDGVVDALQSIPNR